MINLVELLDVIQVFIAPILGYLAFSVNTLHRDVAVLASKVTDLREIEERRAHDRKDVYNEIDTLKNRVTILETVTKD